MYESLKLLLVAFVLPPGGALLLFGLGLLWRKRKPPLGRALCFAGLTVLWLSSLPIVAAALVTALSGAGPLNVAEAKNADAIVILGGGVRARALEYGGDTLGRLTLERVRYGAWLARKTALPVLVTGGSPEDGVRAEADLMREALEVEFGVPVAWADDRAHNTRENAANAAFLLAAEGKRRVVLVMHGFDVRRATKQFEAAGLDVVAAPTFVPRWDDLRVADFLPNAAALHTTHFGLYEVIALGRDAAERALLGRSPALARK